ncbi:hypothetical protein V7S43_010106 [Phytophthora oleae]|uniref:Uncharacterized protein n=1 Tax=Phytophthora oleae TaxID=2107226 RepID=A0ABD3FHB8_9STRA
MKVRRCMFTVCSRQVSSSICAADSVANFYFTEEYALRFDNALQEESITISSPLKSHNVRTEIAPISREYNELRRIYGWHYDRNDIDSPEDSEAWYSNISLVDVETDEFKYQSIESERWFGSLGKAQAVM